MTSRRAFLVGATKATVAGLILGDVALELFERLAHRKVFALGGLPEPVEPWTALYTASPDGYWTSIQYWHQFSISRTITGDAIDSVSPRSIDPTALRLRLAYRA